MRANVELPVADQEGGYTWVPPADCRVAEVRLLHDVDEVGETRGIRSRAEDNLLIAGDALHALTSLWRAPRVTWRYLLVVETAIKTARGSWPMLKKLGRS